MRARRRDGRPCALRPLQAGSRCDGRRSAVVANTGRILHLTRHDARSAPSRRVVVSTMQRHTQQLRHDHERQRHRPPSGRAEAIALSAGTTRTPGGLQIAAQNRTRPSTKVIARYHPAPPIVPDSRLAAAPAHLLTRSPPMLATAWRAAPSLRREVVLPEIRLLAAVDVRGALRLVARLGAPGRRLQFCRQQSDGPRQR